MTRRASTSSSTPLIGAVVLGILLLAAGGIVLFTTLSDSFRGVENLDVQAYQKSAKPFQGGCYQFKGTIDMDLGFEKGAGKLLSFKITSGGVQRFIPALLPEELIKKNLQKGQAYKIKVLGKEKGILSIEAIEKT